MKDKIMTLEELTELVTEAVKSCIKDDMGLINGRDIDGSCGYIAGYINGVLEYNNCHIEKF